MAAFSNGGSITPSKSPDGNRSPHHFTSSNGSAQSSLVYNQSHKGRHYGTVDKGKGVRENGILIHTISASDTLQGIALKYQVPVSEIQRANQLLGNESIHKHKQLKIPLFTPNSSPSLSQTRREIKTKSEVSSSSSSEEEEEVKSKPSLSNTTTAGGERDIMSLLFAVDKQLAASKDFASKLAEKSSALTLPSDAYNRTHPLKEEKVNDASSYDVDTFSDKVKRTFKKTTKWTPAKESEDRQKVEDELFQL